jgi:ribonuclease D
VPVENIVSPDSVRRVLWSPPGRDEATLAARLTELGARPWQVALAAPVLARSMSATTADPSAPTTIGTVARATAGVTVVTDE